MLGIFDRSYVLDKAFPHMPCKVASREEIEYYKKHHSVYDSKSPLEFRAPLYVGGYSLCLPSLLQYRDYFIENFQPIDLHLVADLVDEVENVQSCAVHVRRGDVSGYSTYGYPPEYEYFATAILLIQALHGNVRFYFFSDEADWVRTNLLPNLPDIDYKICDSNDSSKGYLDLYVIAKCKHIIASHGSLGPYGRILSQNNATFITPRYRSYLFENFNNVLVINHGVKFMHEEEKSQKKMTISFVNKIRLKIYQYCREKLAKRGLV